MFFRIHAETVLQAIGFQYERAFAHYALNIGVMSLYSNAEDSLFSARSSLPKYSICCLENCSNAVSLNQKHDLVSFSIRSPEEQLHILEEKGFDWLDGVTTQSHLLSAIDHLDNISYKSTVWNNEMRLAPFLAIRDYHSADRIIASILNQQLGPNSFSSPPWTEEDYAYYATHYPNKNEDLLYLHKLIADERDDSINAYLDEQYYKNTDRLRFLGRKNFR